MDIDFLAYVFCKNLPLPLVGDFALNAYLHQMIAEYASQTMNENHEGIKNAIKYQQVFNYIRLNCNIQLSPKDISEAINMPLFQLNKKFKADIGISLNHYIDSVILEATKEQLLCSDRLIKEIAFEYGFCDEFYFSRFFKKMVGLSPKHYRDCNKAY